MLRLNSRQGAILAVLLDQSRPLSADEIGSHLGVSGRVIRHNLPYINNWLIAKGVRVEVRPKVGIHIVAPDSVRKQLKSEIHKSDTAIYFSPEDRMRLLLFEILYRSGFYTTEQLSHIVSVSVATTMRDLNKAEVWLHKNNLFLQRKAKVGVSVFGRENDIRHALIRLIFEFEIETELIELCLWGKDPGSNHLKTLKHVQTIVFDKIKTWHLYEAWRTITTIENELLCTFADSDHLALALYWAIMIIRHAQNHPIQLLDERVQYLLTHPDYKIVYTLLDKITRSSGLGLAVTEIAQLTIEILTARGEYKSKSKLNLVEISREQSHEIAMKLMDKIGRYTGIELTNAEVCSRLAEHLSRAFVRMHFRLPIQNPLTEEVQQAYPVLWQATIQATGEIWDETNEPFPPEEIAYITMYMALAAQLNERKHPRHKPRVIVACPRGGVTVWMLVSRLRTELPDLEVVKIVSLRDIGQIDTTQAEAIISTVPVAARSDMNVITVSPLLNEQDIEKIKRQIGYHNPTTF